MAAALCLALSSCVEKAPVYVPGEVATGNQAFFKATESKTADIPLTGSYKVKVNRFDSTASATVNIKSSSDAIFTVPSSVSFDAGKGTAELAVSYNVNSLTPDQTYKLALRLASDTTAYAPSFCNVNLYCNPWGPIGQGQYCDVFFIGVVANVTIERYLESNMYRVDDPYPNEVIVAGDMTSWIGGPAAQNIVFTINDDNTVKWDNYFNIGLCYNGDAAKYICMWYPSAFNATNYGSYDAMSKVIQDNVIQLTPVVVFPNGSSWSGWGPKTAAYISMPGGPDLNVLLQ